MIESRAEIRQVRIAAVDREVGELPGRPLALSGRRITKQIRDVGKGPALGDAIPAQRMGDFGQSRWLPVHRRACVPDIESDGAVDRAAVSTKDAERFLLRAADEESISVARESGVARG